MLKHYSLIYQFVNLFRVTKGDFYQLSEIIATVQMGRIFRMIRMFENARRSARIVRIKLVCLLFCKFKA